MNQQKLIEQVFIETENELSSFYNSPYIIEQSKYDHDKTTKELIGFFPDSVVGNDDWLYSPTSISVSDNRIYITDTSDFSLKVYSLEG